jgi:hypothetical protein
MKILAAISLSFLALVACASGQVSVPLPFFPPTAPQPPGLVEVWEITDVIIGKAVVENGCVKVRSPNTKRGTTVLWDQGIELDRDKSGLFLRGRHNGSITRFNTLSEFVVGPAYAEYIEPAYPDVAHQCGPPYRYGLPANAIDAP